MTTSRRAFISSAIGAALAPALPWDASSAGRIVDMANRNRVNSEWINARYASYNVPGPSGGCPKMRLAVIADCSHLKEFEHSRLKFIGDTIEVIPKFLPA